MASRASAPSSKGRQGPWTTPELAAHLAQLVGGRTRATLKPRPKRNLVEWADQERFLSAEASSAPGRWRTDRVEVARGPMLAVTEPGIHQITVMAATQLLKTELMLNVIGYFVHQDPAPILMIQPTESVAEAMSKDRIDPMFRDSPGLAGLLGGRRSRDASNTILHKAFPGGHLTLVGANAPANLAMRPIRVVLADEVDKYPASAGQEGDPISLAAERQATFPNRLLVVACSPTVAGASRIAQEYEASDQRIFEVPCLACGIVKEMQWADVHWPPGHPEEAAYRCPSCGHEWSEAQRLASIREGQWRATKPEVQGHAGFRANKLASPWEPLSSMAAKWEKAEGNPTLEQVFVNTQLADVWADQGEAPPWRSLYDRRRVERSPGEVPAGAVVLTAGVDVQRDRLEVEVVGWGRGLRSWSVDYRVLHGDTSRQEVWDELREILHARWPHELGGSLGLRLMGVDSGFATQEVYRWVRAQGRPDLVVPTKGRDTQPSAISKGSKVEVRADGRSLRGAIKLYHVGVSVLKAEVYGWLAMERPPGGASTPAGWCEFPAYDEAYFRGLTGERLETVTNGQGVPVRRWVRIPGERNEPLDCRVYARAMAALAGLDRWRDRDWAAAASLAGLAAEHVEAPPPPPSPPPVDGPAQGVPTSQAPARRPPRRGGGFWDRPKGFW